MLIANLTEVMNLSHLVLLSGLHNHSALSHLMRHIPAHYVSVIISRYPNMASKIHHADWEAKAVADLIYSDLIVTHLTLLGLTCPALYSRPVTC